MKKRSASPPDKLSAPPAAVITGTAAEAAEVTIEGMSAKGQGLARIEGGRVYIPFALPGERVRILRGSEGSGPCEIEVSSPDRVVPPCKHFGTCGGCALQHWNEDRYQDWKIALIRQALAKVGLDSPVDALHTYPMSSRRRATFTARQTGGEIEFGFLAARTHTVINLDECPILLPQIAAALPHVKAALAIAMRPRSEAKIYVAAAVNGLDCSVQGPPLRAAAHAHFVEALSRAGFIRAVWNDGLVLLKAPPYISCGHVRVTLPPGAFMQAVEACEQDMARWVLAALAEAKASSGPLCDLFAGLGVLTFPAAKLASVTAYEDNPSAVAALASAARRATGVKPVAAIRRDLFRNPLGPRELSNLAGAILDPPREGAEAQCRALALSDTPVAMMLSCNPTTFARDAAILTGGGFVLCRLGAFDQFRYSAHVEIAALFQRPEANRKRGRLP